MPRRIRRVLAPRAQALFAFLLAVPATAQVSADAAPGPQEGVRVIASRREVRVVFPPEPAGPRGWTEEQGRRMEAAYRWWMGTDSAIGGPHRLMFTVTRRDSLPRAFPTLAALAAEGRMALCGAGMMVPCDWDVGEGRVDEGRMVLVVRDTSVITRLFGLRPAYVRAQRDGMGHAPPLPRDSVRVEYVEPAIPPPGAALRAEAARAQRAYEASVNSYTRRITSADNDHGHALHVAAGDTLVVYVEELHCHYDYCGLRLEPVKNAGWSVADTSVVRLLRPDRLYVGRPNPRVLVALRGGRTTVTVTGLGSAADTLPGGESLPRTLSREVVVTQRVGRVDLAASAEVVTAGEPLTLRAEVLDVRGERMADMPFRLSVPMETYTLLHVGPGPLAHVFNTPGRYTVTAAYGGFADTVVITVRPAPADRPE